MSKLNRIRAAFVALIIGILTLSCSSGGSGYQPVSYSPPMYGVNGQCYYIDSPAEAYALRAAGLCQPGWVPWPMPLSHRSAYASYYDGYGYTNRFVPVQRRDIYIHHVAPDFEKAHKADIDRESARAPWKGPKGQTVTGTEVQKQVKSGKASFGGGDRSKGFNSGDRDKQSTAPTPANPPPTQVNKPKTQQAPVPDTSKQQTRTKEQPKPTQSKSRTK